MININGYAVTEQAVYTGVTEGVEVLLKDVKNFSNPQLVVQTISETVLSRLCGVMDFGVSPVRFTPQILQQLLEQAHADAPAPSNPS